MIKKESKGEIVLPEPSNIIAAGIRSIAASFPCFATLGQIWNEYETQRTSERIKELFENINAQLAVLVGKVELHDTVLENCQDFPELLEIVIDKVRKEYEPSKREAYARVLAQFMTSGDKYEWEDKVSLLESLDSLVDSDLRVLLLFRGKEESQISELPWKSLGLGRDDSSQLWELSCHLAKLESRGLILRVSQHAGVIYVRHGLTKAAARNQETRYRVLPAGARLIEAIY